MTTITIYNKDGVRADLVDNEAVLVYGEGVALCEMTRDEWMAISKALEACDEI
jgi:hypothetical protein